MKRSLPMIRYSIFLAATAFLCGCEQIDKLKASREAQLRIETMPTNATVLVNGTPRGETPMTITGLKPGRYALLAQLDGHHDARQTVSLAAGDRRTVKLELAPLTGLVLVHSSPDEAEVSLDGAFRGKTPLMMTDFPAGTHRMLIVKPGYFAKDIEVTVKDRTPQLVDVDLTSDAATLDVSSTPQGAAVLINGANRGTTPCRIEALPSGEVQVELRLAGYATYQQPVKISAGQTFQVNATLTAQPGDLQIITVPAKARVYVDDQLRGESPITLAGLSPVAHRVRVELKGFETDARDVTVKAGGKITEEFRLTQNSGVLMLVTEPGDVRVLIDGEEQGMTKPARAGAVSTTFEVRFLGPGEHTLQLVRPGWVYQPRTFSVESGKAVTLHERMTRLFIPDIEVRTLDDTITGVLLREYASGDLEIERSPGVIIRVKYMDIVERKAIKQKQQ